MKFRKLFGLVLAIAMVLSILPPAQARAATTISSVSIKIVTVPEDGNRGGFASTNCEVLTTGVSKSASVISDKWYQLSDTYTSSSRPTFNDFYETQNMVEGTLGSSDTFDMGKYYAVVIHLERSDSSYELTSDDLGIIFSTDSKVTGLVDCYVQSKRTDGASIVFVFKAIGKMDELFLTCQNPSLLAGNNPSDLAYNVDANYYNGLESDISVSTSWYNETQKKAMTSSDTFEVGNEYSVTATVTTDKYGYFSDDPSAYFEAIINNEAFTDAAEVNRISDTKVAFKWTFPELQDVIKTVSISDIIAPVAGEAPNTTLSLGQSSYTYSASWDGTFRDGKFRSGETYDLNVTLAAKEGYSFDVDALSDESAITIDQGTIYDKNVYDNAISLTIRFTAPGEKVQYVTFDANGRGTAPEELEVPAGTSINDVIGTDTSKAWIANTDGYTMTDWYKEAACINKFDLSTAIDNDVTIYAGWKEVPTITITFDSNGGTGSMERVTLEENEEYTLPACSFTAPEGKEFDKWDKGTVGTIVSYSGDTVIRAQWKDKESTPSAEPTQSAAPTQSAGPAQSTDPTQSAEPAQSAGPAQSSDPTQSAGPAQSTAPTSTTTPDPTSVNPTVGAQLTDSKTGSNVIVTSNDSANPTVEYAGATDKKATDITIPDTVTIDGITYKVTSVKAGACKGNKVITSVTIGKNVTEIGKNAFANCTKLKKVNCKSTVLQKIGASAFRGDKKLVKMILKTKKLKKNNIGKNAIKGTSKKLVITAPKKCVKNYRKYFKAKGNKKVKVK